MNLKFVVLCIIVFFQLAISNAIAFDDIDTHPAITDAAINLPSSKLDGYIKDILGYEKGIDLKMQGRAQVDFKDENNRIVKKGNLGTQSVLNWIKQGSTAEDDPTFCRAVSHFHNPLESWAKSGASDFPPQNWTCTLMSWPTYSAVTWATGYISSDLNVPKVTFSDAPDKSPNNWNNAREDYFQALTSSTNREYYLSKSLGALGQVIHLLEDMAVPAHTRNDFWAHLTLFNLAWNPKNWVYQPFERYVKRNNAKLVEDASKVVTTDTTPSFPDPSLTKFWDTEQYKNRGIPSTATNIGLAEFSSPNFLSDWTIPNNWATNLGGHSFPYPQIKNTSYEICNELTVMPGVKRRYVSRKNAHTTGTGCDHFAVLPLFGSSLIRSNANLNNNISTVRLELDDNVHETYAKELLPRAIGYSSALIDYFFRGKLEVSAPAEHIYAITDGSQSYPFISTYYDLSDPPQQVTVTTQQQQFKTLKAKIKNVTANNEPAGPGTLTAIAEYSIIPNYQPDLSNYPPSNDKLTTALNTTMNRVPFTYSVSAPRTVSSLSSTDAIEYTFSFQDQPIPVGITDFSLYFVFQGTLGNEKDKAIAVTWQDMREPVHQTFWNLTDRYSLNYKLRTSDEIRHPENYTTETVSSAEQALVDLDGNGIYNEKPNSENKNEPYIDPYPMSFEISYSATDPTTSAVYPSASVVDLAPGKHIRLIVLVDDETNFVNLQETDAIAGELNFINTFDPVANGTYDGKFMTIPDKALTLRNVKQHFDTGILECSPTAARRGKRGLRLQRTTGHVYLLITGSGRHQLVFARYPVNGNNG